MGQVYDSESGEPMEEKWSPDLESSGEDSRHGVPSQRVEVVRRGAGRGNAGARHGASTYGGLGAALSPAGSKGGCAAVFGLLMVCLLAFVPGFFSLPVVDRDEARFAQASRQMLESATLAQGLQDPARHGGGWLVPMVQDRERLNKPPLIYWLQASAAGVLTFGRPHADRIWMYRIPSLIAAFVVVLVTWRLGLALFDPRTGAVAGALVAVSPVFAWEAHQARADMVLVAVTVVAQLAMWRVYQSSKAQTGKAQMLDGSSAGPDPNVQSGRGGGLKWAIVFWVAVAAGVMVKGPITPMVAAFTAAGLSAALGQWRWLLGLRPALGVLIVVAAVLPWVWGVAHRVGWDVYLGTIWDEVGGRTLAPKEGHWGPPGYHVLLLPVLFWPGSLLTLGAFGMAMRAVFAGDGMGAAPALRGGRMRARLANMRRAEAPYIFLLAWILPAWLVFEMVSTKLPHYTMPLYPAIAILSAHAVFAAEAGLLPRLRERLGRIGLTVWLLIGGALTGVGFTGLALVMLGSGALATIFFGLVGLAFAGVAFINLKQAARSWMLARYARAQLAGVLVGLAIVIVVVGIAVPRLITLSPAIAGAIDRVDPTGARPVALVRYHEDSMIFLTRGRAQRISADGLDAWFGENSAGLAVVPAKMGEELAWAEVLGRFSGFNYSKGRVEDLALIERGE